MRFLAALLFGGAYFLALAANAGAHTWTVTSPDQGQTFAFGSEKNRQWIARGNHLGIVMEFTNDPYVDRENIRQYDDFSFNFPGIRLGPDRKTFLYRPGNGKAIPVAISHSGFLGPDVRLLPTSELVIDKRHGLVRVRLLVSD